MYNEWWMRPALQKCEAVLLPALPRSGGIRIRLPDRLTQPSPSADPFLPVNDSWPAEETKALSTYVRPRGSMVGRGVLRAAGVSIDPYRRNTRSAVRRFRRF